MRIFGSGQSVTGLVRKHNEDRILVNDDLGLYVVCDGMGGHRHGEKAAELSVAAIHHYVERSRDDLEITWPFGYSLDYSLDGNRLLTGMKLANRQVWRHAQESLESSGMGSTAVAVLTRDGRMVVCHAGDSRLYRLRQGVLQQLTRDDTVVGALVHRGLLKPEEVEKHPLRNILTQAVGAQEKLDIHVCDDEVEAGDTLLLSSDGLHGVVREEAMFQTLMEAATPEQTAARLIEQAMASGAPDNISAIVVRYE